MHIGIFGGSFNPPHLGHLIVAEAIGEAFGLERVLWMPVYRPAHKAPSALAPFEHRLRMVELAVAGNPRFETSDAERRPGEVSYTVETLRRLRAQHPEHRYALLIGEDSYRQLSTWREPEAILGLARVLVYPRYGAAPEPPPPPPPGADVQWADAPRIELASADLRARLRRGASVRYQVPAAVEAYLHRHALYTL